MLKGYNICAETGCNVGLASYKSRILIRGVAPRATNNGTSMESYYGLLMIECCG